MQTTDETELFDLFLRTCETRSLSRAALLLGLSRACASRRITKLEEKLGVSLFVRERSGVSLTAHAERILPKVTSLMDALERLRQSSEGAVAPGTVRISAPTAIGQSLLIPWIADFMLSRPEAVIDITHSMGPVRVMPVGCDLRITHSLFPCERVMTEPLGEMKRLMAASPAYLARSGCPERPEELARHSLLAGNDLLNGNPLVLIRGRERVRVPYLPRLRLHDHVAARAAALAGFGIAVHAFLHDTSDFVRAGKLVRILPGWSPESTPVSMLFPASRPVRPIVRELADFIALRWKSHPDLFGPEEGGIH